MIPVIICGGFGTKMWPLSREFKPKHFLPLINSKSLFQLNYEALSAKFSPNQIYVSTNKDQLKLAMRQVPEIPEENYILEPEMKNTGPAIGLVAATLYKKGFQDEPFMIIQGDVLREPSSKFIEMIEACEDLAKHKKEYITGGLRPKVAIMGVDYLIKGDRVNDGSVGIYKVNEFIWRMSEGDTTELIKNENVLVHSNHTCMTPKNYLEMYKKYRIDWYEPLKNIIDGADVATEFAKMKPDPQEKVTEMVHKNGESLIVELPFKWYDFGTFKSLEEYLKENNLYKESDNIIHIDSENNFIKLDDQNKPVVLVGVNNLIVVDTGDALLICDNKSTSKVGDARKLVIERKIALT